MRKSQFTDQQIVAALRQAEHGTTVGEGARWAACRKLGVTEQTFCRWKRKFAGWGSPNCADSARSRTRTGASSNSSRI